MSELPSKSNIGFMVSTNKEMNGSEMFSLPRKHEMFTYSSGQTDNRNTPEIHTRLFSCPCKMGFYFYILKGFSGLCNSCYFQHTERNRDTQELLLS